MDNAEAPSNATVLEFKEDTALTEVSPLLHDNFSFLFIFSICLFFSY